MAISISLLCVWTRRLSAIAAPVSDIAASIATAVERGHEDAAREMHGDEAVDEWFRANGWDPDATREEATR